MSVIDDVYRIIKKISFGNTSKELASELIDATAGGGGGSFLSNQIARVDLSGNDETGVVGDLTKPFLTVQAAINAFVVAGSGAFPDYGVINTGNNTFAEDLILPSVEGTQRIVFKGEFGTSAFSEPKAFNSLQGDASNFLIVFLHSVRCGGINNTRGGLVIPLMAGAGIQGGFNSGAVADGDVTLVGLGGLFIGYAVSNNGGVDVVCLPNYYEQAIQVVAATDVELWDSIVDSVTCAGSLNLFDGRVVGAISAGSVVYHDKFLDPSEMDFSTLPTDDPGVVGRAWNDSGTVKVSVGPP